MSGVCADADEVAVRTVAVRTARMTAAARNALANGVVRIKGTPPKWSASCRAGRDRSRSGHRRLNDRAAPARSGRLRHREFSHTFVNPAHQAIKKRRAGFLPSVIRTEREKTSTEIRHKGSHAPHSIAGRRGHL